MIRMSAPTAPSSSAGARPLWHAGLAGLIAQATAALIPAMVLRDALLAHLYEGSFKEIGWAYTSPDALTPAWFAALAVAYGWAFLCALPGTLLFMAIVKRMERDEAGTTIEWAVAGAISAIPLAIGLCVLAGTTVHTPGEPIVYLIPTAAACTIGLFGGAVARRFRHRPDWSEPL
jgi:hypothetical protein